MTAEVRVCTHLRVMIGPSSTRAGPTSHEKKIGVTAALNSQAAWESPGKSVRKIGAKPGKAILLSTFNTEPLIMAGLPLFRSSDRRTKSS